MVAATRYFRRCQEGHHMPGILILIIVGAVGYAVWRAINQARSPHVHDSGGKVLTADFGANTGRTAAILVAGFLVLVLVATSVRTVPVGHALVIFNVLTHGFRTADQGVTFVAPFIS